MKKSNKLYLLTLFLIFAVAIFLRFYRINDRLLINFDPARDTMVGREALRLKKIPQIGAFSSAGPFVCGPLYYWEIMLAYLITPNFAHAPWILYTICDLLFIFIMVKVGENSWGHKGGVVLGLITAISSAQLLRASMVNQPTLIPLFGSLVILNSILYVKNKKPLYLFFMGLAIGLALNNHIQALNFFFFSLVIVLVNKTKIKNIICGFLFFIIGVIIPLLPLAFWDYTQDWKNIKNVLDFFLIGQYRLWVSNRWLIYAGKFWPQLWTNVIGGQIIFGYLFMLLTVIFLIYFLMTKKLKLATFLLAAVFLLQVILNRYYRGEKFEGYMLYFYPLVFYFSGLVIINLFKLNKFLGLFFITGLIFCTLKADIKLIKNQVDPSQPRFIMQNMVAQLKSLRPGEKFRIYDYNYLNPAPSMVFSFMLNFENLIDEEKGKRLGFSTLDMPYPTIATVSGIVKPTFIYDITREWDKDNFKQQDWINVSPKYVALDIMEWWKVKEFKSYFCLICFIKEKLGLLQ